VEVTAMNSVIVLGAGKVGSILAVDLARDMDVTVADTRPEALAGLEKGIKTIRADLSDPGELGRVVGPFDMVAGALSSRIGLRALRAVIEADKPYCDISFMPEDALELDALAKDRGVTAVVDCGVAPGMSNLLAGYAAATMDPCERIEIYVGGVPKEPQWPFYYKAAFAPSDVIEEYTRPARYVLDGRVVVREALSEVETVELPGVCPLEGFNTDGLRSLVDTLDVPNIKEKTLRYPGHAELMRVFRETGLFSTEPVDVGGAGGVVPVELTDRLLSERWAYGPGEKDLTVMRVTAEGLRDGRPTRLTWDMLDEYDEATGASSMARTTAFPCAIVARLIADGSFSEPGVFAPEKLGSNPALVRRILDEHEQRGVRYVAAEE
jgi:saccharopine dehydrogenase-like NADP-dependent oxidoreductase